MEPSEKYLFKHKTCYFPHDLVTPEYIDSLEDFEIRDSDVFIVTYPKSGTIWTQHILSLIYYESHRNHTEDTDLLDRAPWLEYNIRKRDYVNRPSPRLFTTHLPHNLVPKGLRSGRAKDLRSSILKICNFLGKSLTEKEVDNIVVNALFDKMKADPRTNAMAESSDLLDHSKGCFLRKGTIGDWKNIMTVAQSERFDSVFKERMKKLPFKFCWDINDKL
ncbi:amine sulfotransferase-like [Sceloporus undulatus]|uniref:amine sulfotransferase-like n=1 Tax=Sceloporus undulatus TaxID=8520 RepID=UPI001C4C3783|nr:amine sulfotransferase-like [Sceloporus undulatus]